MINKKRVVIISDLHCGHHGGLTPPQWQNNTNNVLWKYYEATINHLKPIDFLIVNGDALDGNGRKSGGTELITTDRLKQAEMAVQCIQLAKAKEVMMTYGTGYHTGNDEDFEDIIADKVKATEITGQLFLSVNGVMFDCKHHIESSKTPYGRNTVVSRENVWNILSNAYKNTPKSDVIIRSHVHYHTYCGNTNWLGITTPALQSGESKYGRKCTGIVDVGLIHFDVFENSQYTWESHILKQVNKTKVVKR